jgi:excisionase family DNA binding protein
MNRSSDTDRPYLSDTEIADMLSVPVATVGWSRRCGQLPFVRVGRHPRVRRTDLEDFLAARMVPGLREARP